MLSITIGNIHGKHALATWARNSTNKGHYQAH